MAPTKKKCVVPFCNNVEDVGNKQFFKATSSGQKEKWYEALGQKIVGSKNSVLLCCEDHFDLPNVTENYIRYKYCPGTRLKLRSNAVPEKNIPNHVCRVCLKVIPLHSEYINVSDKSTQQTIDIFKVCLPEIDLGLTSEPVCCMKCFKSLESFYNIKLKALKTEVTVVKCVKEVINKNPEKLIKGTCIDLLENYGELQEISKHNNEKDTDDRKKDSDRKKENVKDEIERRNKIEHPKMEEELIANETTQVIENPDYQQNIVPESQPIVERTLDQQPVLVQSVSRAYSDNLNPLYNVTDLAMI